jgi:transcriptional regulator of NAD metabolism
MWKAIMSLSRRTKNKMKSARKIQRSLERNRQNANKKLGAQSGCGVAQVEVSNDHPVCGIVTGS